MSNSIVLSYEHPGMIDRDSPAEVREAVLEQLSTAGAQLQKLVEASTKQLRNAQLDDFLRESGGNLDMASVKLTEWENGDAAGAIDRLHRLGGLLATAAENVAEACSPAESAPA